MKTSELFNSRKLRTPQRRKYIDAISPSLAPYISGEYLSVASTPSGFSFAVIESAPPPIQSATAGTVTAAVVSELMPTPSQAALLGTPVNVTVSQSAPIPVQSIQASIAVGFVVSESVVVPFQSSALESSGAVKPKTEFNAWGYYPPIYTIRTNGEESAPAPSQRAHAVFFRKPEKRKFFKAKFTSRISESAPTPFQASAVKTRRAEKKRDDEERFLMMLLSQI